MRKGVLMKKTPCLHLIDYEVLLDLLAMSLGLHFMEVSLH